MEAASGSSLRQTEAWWKQYKTSVYARLELDGSSIRLQSAADWSLMEAA